MYDAKREGRDRIAIASMPPPAGRVARLG